MDYETTYIGNRKVWGGEVPFGISHVDRRQHLYAIGKTGTGKTTLLRNLICQDIERGHGVGIIDPHGDLAEELLDCIPSWRADDVLYFNPADSDFPDGFIRVHEKENDGGVSEHTFFLEVDRSSETQETLVNRAASYLDYYKSGGFAIRNGAARSAYKDFPFRVLIVLKNAERRNNTAERLLQSNPPILTQAYLSTFEEVSANPLGAIWIRPVDYREAIKQTGFESRSPAKIYRRQSAREQIIEKVIKKVRLMDLD